MKKEEVLKHLLSKYLDIVEENIMSGHYVETDFRHYSELVKQLVEYAMQNHGQDDLILFTALCLPPFQWFNFDIDKPTRIKVSQLSRMRCDSIWGEYLKYAGTTLKMLNTYRYVLCAENKSFVNERFNLISKNVFEEQNKAMIIFKSDNPLEPLQIEQIDILLKALKLKYKCYRSARKAYLIVDPLNSNQKKSIKQKGYDVEELEVFFNNQFHNTGNYRDVKCIKKNEYKAWIVSKSLPEDLFLVGAGKTVKEARWDFGFTADVVGFEKVRLWFVSDEIDAREKANGIEYQDRFKFSEIKEFVKWLANLNH